MAARFKIWTVLSSNGTGNDNLGRSQLILMLPSATDRGAREIRNAISQDRTWRAKRAENFQVPFPLSQDYKWQSKSKMLTIT